MPQRVVYHATTIHICRIAFTGYYGIFLGTSMVTILTITQIILSVLLIGAILMQSSAAGLGALGGGDSVDAGYHTRRGFEKLLFNSTVVIAILFAVISFAIFLITR